MALRFAKVHGLGNDFLMMDFRAGDPAPTPATPAGAIALCDRKFGVGGDGLLIARPASAGVAADVRMQILNSDGSEAEMCGNGIRAFAKHMYDHDAGLRRPVLQVETLAGVLACSITTGADGKVASVSVEMGRPRLERAEIPMLGAPGRVVDEPIEVAGRGFRATGVSMGNPHAVCFVAESGAEQRALCEQYGPALERHAAFPKKTNAEFAHVVSETEIVLWVFERGCGITSACGTGACATAVAGALTGRTPAGREITLRLPGGPMWITVAKDLSGVLMRGPATHVYDAELDVTALLGQRAD